MRQSERRLTIPAQLPLEGVLHPPTVELLPAGVVVCHPHPQYGGTMGHPVVVAIARELAERGLWALRFNFRGAGGSEGVSTGGQEEAADVAAALACLRSELGPDSTLAVAGYSFGAVMALAEAVSPSSPTRALALVGLPLRFRGLPLPDLTPLRERGIPVLAVVGEVDEYCPLKELSAALSPLGTLSQVVPIAEADHSYWRRQPEVARRVADFLVEALQAATAKVKG